MLQEPPGSPSLATYLTYLWRPIASCHLHCANTLVTWVGDWYSGLWRVGPVVISVLLAASGSDAIGLASSLVLEAPIHTV